MVADVPVDAVSLLTSEPLVAHLAMCANGKPHSAPVWYRYDEGMIEIMTTGRKLANLRTNPHVALSVQKDVAGHPEWRVSIQGTAMIVDDPTVTKEQNQKLNRKYGTSENDWLEENTLVRIQIGTVDYHVY